MSFFQPLVHPRPQQALGYVYDITPMVIQLKRNFMAATPLQGLQAHHRALQEAVIDTFVKHTIEGFQIVGLMNPPDTQLRNEYSNWFQSQYEATSFLWRTLIFPPDVAGKNVYVVRIQGALWLFIPIE